MSYRIEEIKAAARGRWPEIFAALGIDTRHLKRRHGPCPGCGGRDRFRFDDKGGDGTFICGQGGGDPLSGDGFSLVMHAKGWQLPEALGRVAEYLGIGPGERPKGKPNGKTPPPAASRGAERDKRWPDSLLTWENGITDINKIKAHPYLIAKQISPHGEIRLAGDRLLIPIRGIDGTLQGVESIGPNGEKKALPGSIKEGGFYLLGELNPNGSLYLAEGYATGESIHESNGEAVAACSGTNNLLPVAQAFRSKYPRLELIFAADNDTHKPGNPGLTKATKAAAEVGGAVARPAFKGNPEGLKDFNDLFQLHGSEEVRRQLAKRERPSQADNSQGDPLREDENENPKPLVDPSTARIGDMLEAEPKPRRYILAEYLPLGIVGALAAAGGTGKSFLTIQLAVSVATGIPFMGMQVNKPGGALIIAAEDEREEIHRRLWVILDELKREILGPISTGGEEWDRVLEKLRSRLFIVSRVGEDNRIIDVIDRTLGSTGRVRQISELAKQLPDITLIVLDPLSRFRGGDENDNAAAARLVEELESLRAETGATVLVTHHVSKGVMMTEPGRITQEALRGASGLSDGVRWVSAIATLRKDHAANFGVSEERAHKYVRFDIVKNSYGLLYGLWMQRVCGGVLALTELTDTRTERKTQKENDNYRNAIEAIRRLLLKHGPMSARHLEKEYGGAGGVVGVGDKKLRQFLNRAIEEGKIEKRESEDGRVCLLHWVSEDE